MSALLPVLLLAATASPSPSPSPASPGGVAGVSAYELRVEARADGSADVTLTLRLDSNGATTARIPVPFAGVTALRLAEASPGTTVAQETTGERATLQITAPVRAAGPVTVRLLGHVAGAVTDSGAAGRSMRIALMNAEPASIKDLRLALIFPDEWRAQAIREALPKPAKAEAGPRAILEAIDGRPGARLLVSVLPQGETAVLRVDLTPAGRSPGWLIAGVALALLYLRSFRDLVGSPKK